MPKRAPTPPPSDDEPKFLTVAYPYPAQVYMELDEDQKKCAYWIACCIGQENILAIHHKPRSPNMVIIEVRRDYPDFSRLLGEHRWSEFLKNPSQDDQERVSQVFYCTLGALRLVQKNGWKQVVVEDYWFTTREWTATRNLIKSPYPQTHFCSLRPEDQTGSPLCRPLPVISFPPPPPTRGPPVGSPEWHEMKKTQALPRVTVPVRESGALRGLVAPYPARPGFGSPGIVAGGWDTENVSPSSASPSIAAPVSATPPWGARPTLPKSEHVAPPGLRTPSVVSYAGSSNASSTGSLVQNVGPPPGLIHPARTQSGAQSSASSDTDSVIFSPNPDYNPYADPEVQGVGFGTLRHAFVNLNVADHPVEYVDNDDEPEDDWAAPSAPASATVEAYENLWAEEDHDDEAKSLWADYDKPKPPRSADFECPVHQNKCSKGICSEYAKEKKHREIQERIRAEHTDEQGNWRIPARPPNKFSLPGPHKPSDSARRGPRKQSYMPPLAGPPAPSRQMPPHLLKAKTGANVIASVNKDTSPAGPAPKPGDQWEHVRGAAAKAASAAAPQDARSVASSKWGKISEAPWDNVPVGSRPTALGRGRGRGIGNKAPANSAGGRTVSGGSAKGAWGKPPPSPTKAARQDDARSVAGSVTSAWSTKETPWSRSQAKAKPAPVQKAEKVEREETETQKNVRSWADEMDEEDTRSVAAESAWGNISEGPW
ncbi:hypothetical protein CERSUDRAFT_143168 [Gelatoporia subvermispora B]|uniref:Uncharacterized protein n=1 Tax=Ceriporiopsis subvermispora (strain B) TaxID=914234 RepID=M2Q862_CERS8|nr:hypothetical protein CERSUDRAFT_143168 [Gelatoporia subvermispora B]